MLDIEFILCTLIQIINLVMAGKSIRELYQPGTGKEWVTSQVGYSKNIYIQRILMHIIQIKNTYLIMEKTMNIKIPSGLKK